MSGGRLSPGGVRVVAVAIALVLLAGVVAAFAVDDDADELATESPSTTERSTTSTSSTSTTAPGATTSTTVAAATTTVAAPGTTEAGAPAATTPGTDPVPAAPGPGPLAGVSLRLAPITTLNQPIALVPRPGTGELWAAEREGRVLALRGGTGVVVADLTGQVSLDGERGLLGLAFDASGGHVYLGFTDLDGDVRLDELAIGGDSSVVPDSRRTLVEVQHRAFANHNGGFVARGPDGALYLGVGDGGGGGDPNGNAQNPNVQLGKLLRVDPGSGSVSTYASGLRNPWRFSFDRATGDLWLADVGQGEWEEIDRVPFGSLAGANFGWNRMEGTHRYGSGPQAGDVLPVHEYGHDGGRCSVTGGFVYRGSAIPDLQGAYVYGDFCEGVVRGIRVDGNGDVTDDVSFGLSVPQLASFGEDANGELYAISLGGGISRLAQ